MKLLKLTYTRTQNASGATTHVHLIYGEAILGNTRGLTPFFLIKRLRVDQSRHFKEFITDVDFNGRLQSAAGLSHFICR